MGGLTLSLRRRGICNTTGDYIPNPRSRCDASDSSLALAGCGGHTPAASLHCPASRLGEVSIALDSTLAQAGEALARGRPWQATRLLSVALRDSSSRTPAAIFLAATAASEGGGSAEVLQLLEGQPWIDSLYEGRARVLLARAALTRR